ncbi:cytoskeletal protein RodZ [Arthrobacter pascens]|uniref:LytR C-terminal domain-containing protein n=1 Tax=Arthrobacter pascens TaxID=1677 RepID=UPI002793E51A|nr:LytR C-terminal domain-containing protein [Arthrobacter pascens]MDQ0679963.1 cytoskeletal protein RodZ [Arthrobacter pascens]
MTKYARDEFDKVPETASRQGIHRTASAPSRRKLWPILAVGIAALAIGLVSFLILPKLGFIPGGSQASTSVESSASPEASTDPSTSAQPSASAEPSASADAEPSTTPSVTPSSAAVDKSQGVAVYNGSGTAGVAARVSSIVQSDGWTLGQVGNWGGTPQQTSVIFYAGAAQKANAEALSELLNIPTMVDSSDFQAPVVVVLGPGFN